jgi:hypothetical protein
MITLGPALFDKNNRLITLSGRYNNLNYLTQFIVTAFHVYKKQDLFKKNYVVLPVVCLELIVLELIAHTHNAHSKIEYRMQMKLVIAGRSIYPFHYLGTWNETLSAYRWRLKVRNG